MHGRNFMHKDYHFLNKVLAQSSHIVISADGWVIDEAQRWFNLSALLVEQHLVEANVVDV
ncbi:MAG: hypothetical protein AAGJ93_12960 [Bacteroidota bacterium]